MEETFYIRATAGFFVRGRGAGGRSGIVNPDETVQLSKVEAQDVVAASRGVYISKAQFEAGIQADFKPKDHEGKAIPPVTMTRAQVHAAARAQASQQPRR